MEVVRCELRDHGEFGVEVQLLVNGYLPSCGPSGMTHSGDGRAIGPSRGPGSDERCKKATSDAWGRLRGGPTQARVHVAPLSDNRICS